MRHLPLLRRGGWGTEQAWQKLLRDHLFPMLASPADSRQQRAGAQIWVLLGVMLLAVEERGAQLANSKLLRRIEMLSAGDYRGLLGDFCANHAAQVVADSAAAVRSRAPPPTGGASMPEVYAAIRQVRCGELSTGMTTLRNETVAVRGARALSASTAMQFSPSFELSQAERDAIIAFTPERHVVDRALLYEAAKGVRLTAAGGPNGVTAGHMTEVVCEEEGTFNGLVSVVQSLMDGKFAPENINLLTTSNLFALGQRRDPDQLRPIACGDWLVRVASRYMALVLKKPVLQRLEPLQLGSSPCGTEAAYRGVRTFLEQNPGKALILADLSKAFQHLSRAKILDHFMGDPLLSPFVPFLRYLYLNDSDLLLDCGHELGVATLQSTEGTQQGNAASSLIFNEVTHNPLVQIVATCDATGAKLVDFLVAIVDDCSLFCDVENVPEALETLEREYAKVGCIVNRAKTKVLFLDGELPSTWTASLEDGGLGLAEGNIIDTRTPTDRRGARLLGAPIGHPDFERAWLAGGKCFGSFHSDLDLVREKLPGHLHEALFLIKSCICTRASYLPRLLDPELLTGHLLEFDSGVLRTLVNLLGCDYDQLVATGHKALEQMFVKPALGGLGLPPTLATADAAHVASVLDTIPYLRNMHPSLRDYYDSVLQTAADLTSAPSASLGASGDAFITALLNMGLSVESTAQCKEIATKAVRSLLGLPENGTSAGADGDAGAAASPGDHSGGQRRLQYRLSQPVYRALGSNYTANIVGDLERTAQHLSQRTLEGVKGAGFFATGFFTVAPWQEQIATEKLRVSLLLYLGLPDNFLASGNVTCKCGATLPTSSTAALQHISFCNQHGKTFAHDIFGRRLEGPFSTMFTTMSSTALLDFEKIGYPANGFKMDLVAFGLPGYTGALAIDYTLSNPTNASTLNNASLAPLFCAQQAHDGKIAKYQNRIPTGDVFVPCAVELYGGVHGSFVDALHGWADTIAQSLGAGVKPATVLALLRQSFSISLMEARVELYKRCIDNSIEPNVARRREIARQSYVYRAVRRARRCAQVKAANTRSGDRGSYRARTAEGRFGRR